MGVAIIHHSPLWAQEDRKIIDLFKYKFSLDSVWDLLLYIGDRMELANAKKLNQFSSDLIFANPLQNPCYFSGGTFEGFTVNYSLLILGYPYYFAHNKNKTEKDESLTTEEMEVVQMWLWYEIGEACCKIKVSSDDDWLSILSSSMSTPYSMASMYLMDIESLMGGEDAYVPQKKYPLGTWDQIDLSQYLLWSLYSSGGCSGGLFGGGDWFSEYEYEKISCSRLKWEWDFYKLKTEDFATKDEAENAYSETHSSSPY